MISYFYRKWVNVSETQDFIGCYKEKLSHLFASGKTTGKYYKKELAYHLVAVAQRELT